MFRDTTKDLHEELTYTPITLFGEKINVGVIGAGRGALIKTRNFYKKGSYIEVLALDFLEEFYDFNKNQVKLIKGAYYSEFINNKHLIIIAIDNEEIINQIKSDCDILHKIYINSSNFKNGMGVIPVSRESQFITLSVNTKIGNPRGSVMVADAIGEILPTFDEYINLTGKIRNEVELSKDIKDQMLKFINSSDCKYFFDKGKLLNIFKLFYSEDIVNKISFLGKED